MQNITAKQRKFVDAYFLTWCATKAARMADYAFPEKQGHRLTKTSVVAEEIRRRMAESAMEADEVLSRLGEQARVNISDFVHDDGQGGFGINWAVVQERGHLIKAITMTKHGPRLELHDGQAALIYVGKKHGLFVDRQEVRQQVDAQVQLYLPEQDKLDNQTTEKEN